MVQHHLIKLLDAADARGEILKEILIVPYANPIGLSQIVMGYHMGRFSLDTGVNFNRDWIDVSGKVIASVKDKLSADDARHNVRTIRAALLEESAKINNQKIENVMKKELYRLACVADIVLDLHCDCGKFYFDIIFLFCASRIICIFFKTLFSTEAMMHLYMHDRSWPSVNDLAFEIDSHCNITSPKSGGSPFDEAMSCPWASLAEAYPSCNIPMACDSVTVELRGEVEVGYLPSIMYCNLSFFRISLI